MVWTVPRPLPPRKHAAVGPGHPEQTTNGRAALRFHSLSELPFLYKCSFPFPFGNSFSCSRAKNRTKKQRKENINQPSGRLAKACVAPLAQRGERGAPPQPARGVGADAARGPSAKGGRGHRPAARACGPRSARGPGAGHVCAELVRWFLPLTSSRELPLCLPRHAVRPLPELNYVVKA